MPTEACYVVSIETAIFLCTSYGVLSVYFDDLMSSGFLFFAVFIGLSLSYVAMVVALCLLLLDSTTSKQIVLLDYTRGEQTDGPNDAAHLSRVLARSGSTCSVAVFILFVTVGCQFFTDEGASVADSLTSIALKKLDTESHLTTQVAVSTAFAVFFVLVLMLLSSSQQLNGIFVRLQHMADGAGAPQLAALTSAWDDLALFVRALAIAYLIVCDSVDTLKNIPDTSMAGVFVNALPSLRDYDVGIRNSTSLLFIVWVWLLDCARTFLPEGIVVFVLLELLDMLHVFLGVVTIEALLHDMTVTNMACTALVGADACFVLYASVHRIYRELHGRKWAPTRHGPAAAKVYVAHAAPAAQNIAPSDGIELTFNAPGINESSLNWGTFEKKIK
jgi:hypothetical protein